MQDKISKRILEELSAHPRNDTGWTSDNGETPPSVLIGLARDIAIKELSEIFIIGAEFETTAGVLTVREFNTKWDPEAKINRFADIGFDLDGRDAGSFVFRASANDPTWVMVFETPIWEGLGETLDSFSAQVRLESVGGFVLETLQNEGIAGIACDDVVADPNKSDAEQTLAIYKR